jgi:hypothetical protein
MFERAAVGAQMQQGSLREALVKRLLGVVLTSASNQLLFPWSTAHMECLFQDATDPNTSNNDRDLFYVIALFPHQHPAKVDPRRWHCKQSYNAAARVRRQQFLTVQWQTLAERLSMLVQMSRTGRRASHL